MGKRKNKDQTPEGRAGYEKKTRGSSSTGADDCSPAQVQSDEMSPGFSEDSERSMVPDSPVDVSGPSDETVPFQTLSSTRIEPTSGHQYPQQIPDQHGRGLSLLQDTDLSTLESLTSKVRKKIKNLAEITRVQAKDEARPPTNPKKVAKMEARAQAISMLHKELPLHHIELARRMASEEAPTFSTGDLAIDGLNLAVKKKIQRLAENVRVQAKEMACPPTAEKKIAKMKNRARTILSLEAELLPEHVEIARSMGAEEATRLERAAQDRQSANGGETWCTRGERQRRRGYTDFIAATTAELRGDRDMAASAAGDDNASTSGSEDGGAGGAIEFLSVGDKVRLDVSTRQILEGLRLFLQHEGEPWEIFPPMNQHDRQTLHDLAHRLNMNWNSIDTSKGPVIVLDKTSRTPAYNLQEFNEAVSVSLQGLCDDEKSERKDLSKDTVGTLRSGSSGAAIRNGKAIGASAAEIGEDNFGHRLMQKMGWSKGMALGKEGGGILLPVEQVMRFGRGGLG